MSERTLAAHLDAMTDPITYTNPSISIEDRSGTVRLTVWTDVLARESLHIELDPTEALALMAGLANSTRSAAAEAASAIVLGDCPTCRNTRLVDETRHGRPWRVHCPDCNADGKATTGGFPAFPRIGGGIR